MVRNRSVLKLSSIFVLLTITPILHLEPVLGLDGSAEANNINKELSINISAQKPESAFKMNTGRGLLGGLLSGLIHHKTTFREGKCSWPGLNPLNGKCNKYLDCVRRGDNGIVRTCPRNQAFDWLKYRCVKASEARCRGLCNTRGQIYPDPNSVYRYLKCVGGRPKVYRCPVGREFDVELMTCVIEDSGEEDSEFQAPREMTAELEMKAEPGMNRSPDRKTEIDRKYNNRPDILNKQSNAYVRNNGGGLLGGVANLLG